MEDFASAYSSTTVENVESAPTEILPIVNNTHMIKDDIDSTLNETYTVCSTGEVGDTSENPQPAEISIDVLTPTDKETLIQSGETAGFAYHNQDFGPNQSFNYSTSTYSGDNAEPDNVEKQAQTNDVMEDINVPDSIQNERNVSQSDSKKPFEESHQTDFTQIVFEVDSSSASDSCEIPAVVLVSTSDECHVIQSEPIVSTVPADMPVFVQSVSKTQITKSAEEKDEKLIEADESSGNVIEISEDSVTNDASATNDNSMTEVVGDEDVDRDMTKEKTPENEAQVNNGRNIVADILSDFCSPHDESIDEDKDSTAGNDKEISNCKSKVEEPSESDVNNKNVPNVDHKTEQPEELSNELPTMTEQMTEKTNENEGETVHEDNLDEALSKEPPEENLIVIEVDASKETKPKTIPEVVAEDGKEICAKPAESRTRKPSKSDSQKPSTSETKLPCHMLGRNLTKPLEDTLSNGRQVPKPRLGVKVPFRHLTSQICSKEEITKEVIEHTTKLSQNSDIPPAGDMFFARKLFHRLAEKILPKDVENPETPKKSGVENSNESVVTNQSNKHVPDEELLAILEGDGDLDINDLKRKDDLPPVLTPENITVPPNFSAGNTPPKLAPRLLDPELERELALQQLKSMPDMKPGRRRTKPLEEKNIRASLRCKSSLKPIKARKNKRRGATEEIISTGDPNDPFTFVERNENYVSAPKVVKTYSRKDSNPEEEPDVISVPREILEIDVPDSKETNEENNTKSKKRKADVKNTKNKKPKESSKVVEKPSHPPQGIVMSKKNRIIKKKIIWDPDADQPVRLSSIKKTNTKYDRPIVKKAESATKKSETTVKKSVEETPTKKSETSTKKSTEASTKETESTVKKSNIVEVSQKPEKSIVETKENDVSETTENKTKSVTTKPKKKLLGVKKSNKAYMLVKQKIKKTASFLVGKHLPRLPNGRFLNRASKNKSSVDVPREIKKKVPSSSKKVNKKTKKLTEVDRLLQDEGALNMLYSMEQDENTPMIKQKQRIISMDKFEREMSKKKKMIKSVLSTTPESTPKALRKKDIANVVDVTMPVRKKSRDSIRSSVHTPPASPSAMFPPRAEASRIIRRHSSSSSFSSECMSPRRLSTTEGEQKSQETTKSTGAVQVNTEEKPVNVRKKGGVPIYVKQNEEKTYRGKIKRPIERTEEPETENVESQPQGETAQPRESKIKLTTADKRRLNLEMAEMFNKQAKTKIAGKTNAEKESVSRTDESVGEVTKKQKVSHDPDVEAHSSTSKSSDVEKKRESDEKRTSGRQTTTTYKEICLRKHNHLVQIIITPISTKASNAFNLQILTELTDALNTLKQDVSCRAVLLSSTGSVFCSGLDYSTLVHSRADKRKSAAQEMATAVKVFIRALAHFPRPVIVGVQGSCVGLGVALLPLCDIILASDKATFSMPHARLGCVPEGGAVASLPHATSYAMANELLQAGHTLTAAEALKGGLVTRVLWPDNFQQELIPVSKTIASQSVQAMEATKALLRQSLLTKVDAALETESQLLVQHWTSAECQQNFKITPEQLGW